MWLGVGVWSLDVVGCGCMEPECGWVWVYGAWMWLGVGVWSLDVTAGRWDLACI